MMNAHEFYRKRLIEMSDGKATERLNRIVCIDKPVQILEEFIQLKHQELHKFANQMLKKHMNIMRNDVLDSEYKKGIKVGMNKMIKLIEKQTF
jgi:hypothetical protein